MKQYRLYILSLVLLTIFSFAACEEMQNSTTLRLRFSPSTLGRATGRDVISPEGQGLAITGYVVSGSGPNDNTFSVSTASSQVDINGLVIGTWDISVTGLNQQGTTIATGSVTHHLTTSENTVEVALDEFSGEGFLDIGFSWNDPNYPDIELDLRLKPQNEAEQVVTTGKSIHPSSATARYQTTLDTGSYDLSFTLRSGGTRIAGGVVAIRILDGFTSAKEITIIVDTQTPEATGLLINSAIVEPVDGTIQGLPDPVLPLQQVTAQYVHNRGGGASPLSVDWYLDGEHLGNGTSVDFSTHSGEHRLDAVARTQLLGSVGSATYPFRASVETLGGTPLMISDLSQGDVDSSLTPYRLNGVSAAAFLRDGRLLTASSTGLQLCEIVHDSPEVVRDFTSTGNPLNTEPYPVIGVTDILVDTIDDIVITTARESGIVVVYRYNRLNDDLERIRTFAHATGAPWEGSVINAAIDQASNRLYLVDPAYRSLYHCSYTAQAVGDLAFNSIAASVDANHLALSADGTRLTIASLGGESATIQTFQVSEQLDGLQILLETNFSLGTTVPPDMLKAWPVQEVMHVNLSDGLYLFSPPTSGQQWIQGNRFDTGTDTVRDIVYDASNNTCWTIEGPNTPNVRTWELIFGVPTTSSAGSTSTGTFVPTDICRSPAGDLLATCGGQRLMILRISDN